MRPEDGLEADWFLLLPSLPLVPSPRLGTTKKKETPKNILQQLMKNQGLENWIVPFEDKYQTEVKYDDHVPIHSLVTPTSYVMGFVHSVDQGAGESERIGRKVHVLRAYLRGVVHQQQDNDANYEPSFSMRVLVINDKQPNGALCIPTDFLADTTYPTISPINMSNRRRFEVLYDKTYDCDAIRVNTGTSPQRGSMINRSWHSFQEVIDIERDVMYNGDGTISTNIIFYAIFVDAFVTPASDQNFGSMMLLNIRNYYTDV